MKLDFSEFHPLDHALWSCRDHPGGIRRHLSLWWDYSPGSPEAVFHRLLCRIGRHDMTDYWSGTFPETHDTTREPDGQMCRWCYAGEPRG